MELGVPSYRNFIGVPETQRPRIRVLLDAGNILAAGLGDRNPQRLTADDQQIAAPVEVALNAFQASTGRRAIGQNQQIRIRQGLRVGESSSSTNAGSRPARDLSRVPDRPAGLPR